MSRSLQACEGALLVVDASQGVEAQTLANVWLAIENDLEIVPILNKIDLPGGCSIDPASYWHTGWLLVWCAEWCGERIHVLLLSSSEACSAQPISLGPCRTLTACTKHK